MWSSDQLIQKSRIDHASISNSYLGNTDKLEKIFQNNQEPGNRDSNAGIQYYTPKQGINRKTLIPPIIAPRSLDQDVWGKSNTVRSNINEQTSRDITYSDLDVDDMVQKNNPLVNSESSTQRSLGVPQLYEQRTMLPYPNQHSPLMSLVPQNYAGENTDRGSYNSGATMFTGGMNQIDYKNEVLPIYRGDSNKKENNFPAPTVKMYHETNDEDDERSCWCCNG